ncbi:response regulator [Bacillus sp. FJAT-28004]|uniref:response regulator n=1 Tax=Bacillus sp. FJAT-28004 TaxID=1679165 RepID=UPI0006B5D616|nr:response regulator [Bacillus sp. FJAT-28004]
MEHLVRNVMIIDDSKNILREIKAYNRIFESIKEHNKIEYSIQFIPIQKYDEAINLLQHESEVFDVLLIDYDLRQSGNTEYGSDLVREIRSKINKHCKIIFYTMGDLAVVFSDRNELISLFNEGIYKFLSKDTISMSEIHHGQPELQLRVETIIEAINSIDFVQVTLERYFAEYGKIISDERILVNNKEYTINEIISLIKRDEDTGRIYKSNLAESIIIHNIISGGQR